MTGAMRKTAGLLILVLCLFRMEGAARAAEGDDAAQAAGQASHFTLDTPPAEVLKSVPSLAPLSNLVGGGWGKTWQEASILVDDASGSDMLTTRYVVATQNMLMALRASLEEYSSRDPSDPEILIDYERVSREFYWGAQGQALERIEFRALTVPAGRLAEARQIADNPLFSLDEKRLRLSRMTRSHDAVYWFDISAPFRHNSRIIWR